MDSTTETPQQPPAPLAVASKDLLACPFCGELPEYEPWAQGHAPEYAWPHQIVHNCKVTGQKICVRAHKAGMPDTKESVFAMWNTRAVGKSSDLPACHGKLPDPTPEQAKCKHDKWRKMNPQPRHCVDCGLLMWDAGD